MTNELKPCPCGKVPTDLHITEGASVKWSWASGNCCGEWQTDFRTFYTVDPDELMGYAIAGWNVAPRGERVCEWILRSTLDGLRYYLSGCRAGAAISHNRENKFCGGCGGKIQIKEQP